MICAERPHEARCPLVSRQPRPELPSLALPRVRDFALTGRGDATAWSAVPWTSMAALDGDATAYRTRLKAAYSDAGVYVLVECEDRILSTRAYADHADVWKGDVVEVFLWPDESRPLYFQYAITPLGAELPLLVPNDGVSFVGWSPWHYEGARRVRARTHVDGPREPRASVRGWSVELCVPYRLLSGLVRQPPGPGSIWRGNVYRTDHDGGSPRVWAWCDRTGPSTHEFRSYGSLVFTR